MHGVFQVGEDGLAQRLIVGTEGRVYAVDIDGDALKKLRKTLADEDTSRVILVHSEPDDPKMRNRETPSW